jgi:hypothetical protein
LKVEHSLSFRAGAWFFAPLLRSEGVKAGFGVLSLPRGAASARLRAKFLERAEQLGETGIRDMLLKQKPVAGLAFGA